MFPMIDPAILALTTLGQPLTQGDDGDDQFGRIAQGGIEQRPDLCAV